MPEIATPLPPHSPPMPKIYRSSPLPGDGPNKIRNPTLKTEMLEKIAKAATAKEDRAR